MNTVQDGPIDAKPSGREESVELGVQTKTDPAFKGARGRSVSKVVRPLNN